MTTRTAIEALSELSEKINDYEFDPAKRTYYGIAIDTAVKELVYQQQSYMNLEQQRAIQDLWYKIFKEGGDMP